MKKASPRKIADEIDKLLPGFDQEIVAAAERAVEREQRFAACDSIEDLDERLRQKELLWSELRREIADSTDRLTLMRRQAKDLLETTEGDVDTQDAEVFGKVLGDMYDREVDRIRREQRKPPTGVAKHEGGMMRNGKRRISI